MTGTNASFMPATVPECGYAPRMTRAAALALRTAGALQENCVVVITDGPVIGTAGNTSATEIELQPSSPTELGLTALVHTAFDNEAWPGLYDIDLGTGTITRLEGNRGNVVDDPTGATVMFTFPWHNTTVQRNVVNGPVTLTGWGTLNAAAVITDNVITNGAAISLGSTLLLLDGNTFNGGTVSATGALGSLNMTGSTFNNSTITKTNAGGLIVTDTQLVGSTLNWSSTAGNSSFRRSILLGSTVTRSGTGGSNIFDTTMRAATAAFAGGNYSLFACDISGGTLNGPATGVRGLSLTNVTAIDTVITQARTNATNADVIQNSIFSGHSQFNLTGATDGGTPVNTIYEDIEVAGASIVTVDAPSNISGAAATQIHGLRVAGVSTLNLQGSGARIVGCRVDAGATVNTGGFTQTSTIVEFAGVTTLTAANVGRLKNAGFNNTI